MKTRLLLLVVTTMLACSHLFAGSVYGKWDLAGKTVEVVVVGTNPYCDGGAGYTVREVGQTPTFDIVVSNGPTFSVGQQICIGTDIGTPPCGALPRKYDLPECNGS